MAVPTPRELLDRIGTMAESLHDATVGEVDDRTIVLFLPGDEGGDKPVSYTIIVADDPDREALRKLGLSG